MNPAPDLGRAHPARRSFAWAILITLLAAAAAVIVYRLRAGGLNLPSPRTLPDVGEPENGAQRLAQVAGLLTLLCLTAATLCRGICSLLPSPGRRSIRVTEAVFAAALIVTIAAWVWTRPDLGWSAELWGGYSIFTVPGKVEAELGLLSGALVLGFCLLALHWLPARLLPALMLSIAVLDCALLVLPGLLAPVRLDGVSYTEMLPMEAHYGALLGDRLQLRAGIPFVTVVRPDYGFFMPVVLAILERSFGALDLGQNVRLIQLSQVTFLAVYAAALLVQARGAWIGVAIALLLVAPWVGTLHLAIFHPNQAGYRFLGFALGLLTMSSLARCRNRLAREAWLLGVMAGIGLLLNYETGVALGAGIVVFLALRLPRHGWLRSVPAAALRFTVAFLAVHAAYWLIAWIGLGITPVPFAALFWPLYTGDIGARVGGNPMYFDPWLLGIVLCAAITLVRTVLAARLCRQQPEPVLLAAAAAIILVWLAYWMAEPHLWNDWSYFALFGPFIVWLLRPENLHRYTALARRLRPAPGALVAIAVLGPATYASQLHALPAALDALHRPAPRSPQNGRVLSGVWFRADVADRLEAKAAAIRAAAARGTVTFISDHGFTLTVLSGRPQPLKVRETTFELTTQQQRDAYVKAVLTLAPDRILIDAETAPDEIPTAERDIFDAVQRSFGVAYALEGTADGWHILRRR